MRVESFAIVELKIPAGDEAIKPAVIVHIVRTYETRSRAAEDLDLLRDTVTSSTFEIVPVEHIDA